MSLRKYIKPLPLHLFRHTSRTVVAKIPKVTHDLVFLSDLSAVLGQSNTQAKNINPARVIDGLEKVGYYYRATRQLVSAARKKCHLFRNIRVIPYDIKVPAEVKMTTNHGGCMTPVKTLVQEADLVMLLQRFDGSECVADGAITKRLDEATSGLKVHAEIKLLFFHERNPQARPPRVIPASKSSCYLCDVFIHIHGVFQTPTTFVKLQQRSAGSTRDGSCRVG